MFSADPDEFPQTARQGERDRKRVSRPLVQSKRRPYALSWCVIVRDETLILPYKRCTYREQVLKQASRGVSILNVTRGRSRAYSSKYIPVRLHVYVLYKVPISMHAIDRNKSDSSASSAGSEIVNRVTVVPTFDDCPLHSLRTHIRSNSQLLRRCVITFV